VQKGGKEEDTCSKKCLCNGLMSTVGLPQVQTNGYIEPPMVTAGKYVGEIANIVGNGRNSYSAQDVLTFLLDHTKAAQTAPILVQ
jgi:hypothetical protein